MAFYFGLDTSNYTTSAAVYCTDDHTMRMEKKLLPTAKGALGLRQSDAVFAHVKQLGEVAEALFSREFGGKPPRFSAVGVSAFPRREEGSYMPCFLVGETTGRVYAAGDGLPLYRFSHQEGHIAAALYSAGALSLMEKPFLAFHLSGGTTDALLVTPEETPFKIQRVAGSLDLKAGQVVDRVGLSLGLNFPCGPQLTALAAEWEEPVRARATMKGADCCLSGIENQCAGFLKEGRPRAFIARYCIEAVKSALIGMTDALLAEYGKLPVLYAGGVMSSSIIQADMKKRPGAYFAQPAYSSDNAAGIALLTALCHESHET